MDNILEFKSKEKKKPHDGFTFKVGLPKKKERETYKDTPFMMAMILNGKSIIVALSPRRFIECVEMMSDTLEEYKLVYPKEIDDE